MYTYRYRYEAWRSHAYLTGWFFFVLTSFLYHESVFARAQVKYGVIKLLSRTPPVCVKPICTRYEHAPRDPSIPNGCTLTGEDSFVRLDYNRIKFVLPCKHHTDKDRYKSNIMEPRRSKDIRVYEVTICKSIALYSNTLHHYGLRVDFGLTNPLFFFLILANNVSMTLEICF